MNDFLAIIPAAGSGVRFGGGTKKQFLLLQGKTLLQWTLETFLLTKLFKQIAVCLPLDQLEEAQKSLSHPSLLWVQGGASRSESVSRGFQALDPKDEDVVLVHDAVRPLVSASLIQRVAQATKEKGTMIPALPLTDTIKEVQNGIVQKTIDRTRLQSVQTPQGFPCGLLRKVYEYHSRGEANELHPEKNIKIIGPHGPSFLRDKNQRMLDSQFTDEAMLIESLGEPVHVIEGERQNIKVTTPFDMKLAEFFLRLSEE